MSGCGPLGPALGQTAFPMQQVTANSFLCQPLIPHRYLEALSHQPAVGFFMLNSRFISTQLDCHVVCLYGLTVSSFNTYSVANAHIQATLLSLCCIVELLVWTEEFDYLYLPLQRTDTALKD